MLKCKMVSVLYFGNYVERVHNACFVIKILIVSFNDDQTTTQNTLSHQTLTAKQTVNAICSDTAACPYR